MKFPIVSVLMTAYNREDYIAQAIESVLISTLSNFELLIVDDQSKDKTVEIAESYAAIDKRIRVFVNEQNLGDYPNRNKAASHATGKYIKYLDSDDMIYPHGLEVMVRSMETFPEAGYGLSSLPDTGNFYPACISPKEAYFEHFFKGFGHFDRSPGSSIIRTEAFNKVGGFSGKRMIGDYEMWFKLSQEYDLVKFPRDLVWHRSHQKQESQSDFARQYASLRKNVLEQALQSEKCPLGKAEIMNVRKQLNQRAQKQKMLKVASKLGAFLK
ncbi:glycosyltransferase [Pontibacter saemangeumensis]|uniref:Glycosyltransferase n=1 Tax=Pontibacter saemangeumensis TaxID=1084525 RepID=A0ABP8LC18_9BACT